MGERPRVAIATTPRPTKLIRDLLQRDGRDLVVSRGTSFENSANLAPEFLSQITRKYEGTRLGGQELLGELLTDLPGALWTRDIIEALRRDRSPPLRRVVIGVDPSGGEDGDEVGIIVAGLDEDDHGWVLVDASGQYSPNDWAQLVARLYYEHHADRVVAEVNFGGGMVESVLRAADRNIASTPVHASRGKVQRAEPVSALYEQGKVHHLGTFPQLEDELCNFSAAGYVGPSPGRADALVWSLTNLMGQPMKGCAYYEVARRRANGETLEQIAGGAANLQAIYDAATRIRAGLSPFAPMPGPEVPDDQLIDGETAWRRRYAAQHGGWINGPNAQLSYAPGSVEFERSKNRP
jgi:phage terminase large subunit-like protein